MTDDDMEKNYGGHDRCLKKRGEKIAHLQISPDIPK